jgi:uncharacterized protein YbjT (DUF2867 family)
MKVVLFGATGMVGQGVLRECLLDPDVTGVLAVGRASSGQSHAKLRELVHADFTDFAALEAEFTGFDACFYCLGVSVAGLSEAAYRHLTYDFTLAAASALAHANPNMTFIYVSGAGTDSTEHGRSMWARVKGATENALLRLPFKAACMFRPALIQPLHDVRSKTATYRAFYAAMRPLLPWLYARFPRYVTTTAQVGRAMIAVARRGPPQPILESEDINRL